jgi:hypothetical protein
VDVDVPASTASRSSRSEARAERPDTHPLHARTADRYGKQNARGSGNLCGLNGIASCKRRAAPAVAVLLLLGACGGSGDDASRKYNSREYGYSITLPRSWDAVNAARRLTNGEPPATSTGATDIFGRHASTRVGTMQLPGVIIAAQPVRSDTPIESWASSIVQTVAFMKHCDQPNRRDEIEIAGERGTLLTYRDCPPELGYLHLWAGVVHSGMGFHIVWFNNPGHENSDRASFESMLSSMSFKD